MIAAHNHSNWRHYPASALAFCLALASASGADLPEARVTQTVKEVKLLPRTSAVRAIGPNTIVPNGSSLWTGENSRAELTFHDQRIARLGASTILGLTLNSRDLELKDGVALVRSSPAGAATKINIASLAGELKGATAIFEFHPQSYLKVISLQGTSRIYLPSRMGESVLVHPGEMLLVRADARALPDPVEVDLNKIAATSLLVNGFARPLDNEKLIAEEGILQQKRKKGGQLFETNLAIFGGGTTVSLLDSKADAKTSASPSSSRKGSAKSATPPSHP